MLRTTSTVSNDMHGKGKSGEKEREESKTSLNKTAFPPPRGNAETNGVCSQEGLTALFFGLVATWFQPSFGQNTRSKFCSKT